MKFVFPDGREMPAKNINTARLDAVIELQKQSGLKLLQLRREAQESEAFGMACVYFLSFHCAGTPVKWSWIQGVSMADLPVGEFEPGDPGYKDPAAIDDGAEGEAADPQVPAPGSDATPGADELAAAATDS